jgi:hypothetical protein
VALAAEATAELVASLALVEAVAAEVAELPAETPAASAFKDAVVALAAEAEALVAAPLADEAAALALPALLGLGTLLSTHYLELAHSFCWPNPLKTSPRLTLFVEDSSRDLYAIDRRRTEPHSGRVRQGVRNERGLQNSSHGDLKRTRMAYGIVKWEIRQRPRSNPRFGWNNRRAGCLVCFINDSCQSSTCISGFCSRKRCTKSGIGCLSGGNCHLLSQLSS